MLLTRFLYCLFKRFPSLSDAAGDARAQIYDDQMSAKPDYERDLVDSRASSLHIVHAEWPDDEDFPV